MGESFISLSDRLASYSDDWFSVVAHENEHIRFAKNNPWTAYMSLHGPWGVRPLLRIPDELGAYLRQGNTMMGAFKGTARSLGVYSYGERLAATAILGGGTGLAIGPPIAMGTFGLTSAGIYLYLH